MIGPHACRHGVPNDRCPHCASYERMITDLLAPEPDTEDPPTSEEDTTP